MKLQDLVHDPHPHIDVYVNDADMSFLKVIIEVRSASRVCFLGSPSHKARLLATSINAHIKVDPSY
jgi:hypothetical protein